MSREYPDWVNPLKAAEGKRIFSGTMPLRRLSRLVTLLASADGAAGFTASFGLDAQKQVTVLLEVTAELPLVCQASLEPFLLPVRRKSLLAVIEDEAEQGMLPEDYEPTRVENGRLEFAGLVEDELLLAVPQVPRKPGLEAVSFSTDPESDPMEGPGEHNRPFAALGDLMRGGKQDQNSDSD